MKYIITIGVSKPPQLKINKSKTQMFTTFSKQTIEEITFPVCEYKLWVPFPPCFHYFTVFMVPLLPCIKYSWLFKNPGFHDCWTCIVFAAHMNLHFHSWFYFQGHPVIGVVWFTRSLIFVFFLIFSLSLDFSWLPLSYVQPQHIFFFRFYDLRKN